MLSKRQLLLVFPASLAIGLTFRAANAVGHTGQNAFAQINALLTEYAFRLDAGQIEQCAAMFTHAEFTIEGLGTVQGK
ncbi:hypothetical protein ACMU_08850 [Actibacterium mucosum KCTC 23349]|uniref:SnoaL-like domain-containing protein n=1 Tax=Actibacterium mucosum KCTC 23349 TaxID=1454373 RepID=A0A037ZHG1_9RHOB|nr:hypothetical protein [Actibacterium mucosum]KAJ55870.1 hypothetical protein ACMU_08850 [Actibacterium mucosum KCTC 23349]